MRYDRDELEGRDSYREGFFKFLNSVSGMVQKSRDTGMNSAQSVPLKRSRSGTIS